ncbi:hypothetical protein KIN20_012062 [Parelaphostrongylus tenuis]|uniref:long-chain-fatty-acid--CoA ligase n=1 Tax=Parelaphostrongylus tenuis TaxID=148309 RepID=A0AAD5N0U4_PARTN|nr:hypothetical protein KIN20_012062 [Parelaphostrongylus tenuis]
MPVIINFITPSNRIFQLNIRNQSLMSRIVHNIAYSMKLALLKKGITTTDTIWDKLAFRKFQAQFGGKVQLMVTGGAPILPEVIEMSRVVYGATILEGYGQTECTGTTTMTWPGEWIAGHCGGVASSCHLKLADVPELKYFSKDGKGEIMIRGPILTKGYYKDPQKTAELFDENGFLHTGDVGEILPNGTIRLIDRKKHIFKLAQGEYVAPDKIESVYLRCPVVEQVFVDGDSLERWLIAVVVPDRKILEDWNAKHGVEGRSFERICEDKKISHCNLCMPHYRGRKLPKRQKIRFCLLAQEYVLSQLRQIGAENKLNSIEQVKRVYLEREPFSVENGLLTATLKAKRPHLRQKYKNIMEKIYRENKYL